MCGEIVALGEFQVALVRQLVGETVGIFDTAFQHLDHKGLGIGHVAQAVCLHGIVEKPRVGDEFVDRRHLGDVVRVVLGFPSDQGLVLDARQRPLDITRDELVAGEGADQGRSPAIARPEYVTTLA